MSISLPPPDPQALMRATGNMEVPDFGSVEGNIDSSQVKKAGAHNLTSTDICTLIASNREEGTKSYEEQRIAILTPDSPTLLEVSAVENFAIVMDDYSHSLSKTGAKTKAGDQSDGENFVNTQSVVESDEISQAKTTSSVNLSPVVKSNDWFAPSIMAAVAKYMSEIIKVSMVSSLKEAEMGILFFSLMGETAKDVKALYLAAAEADAQKERNNAYASFIQAGAAIGSAAATGIALGASSRSSKQQEQTETADLKNKQDQAKAKKTRAEADEVKHQNTMNEADQQIKNKQAAFNSTAEANPNAKTPAQHKQEIENLQAKKAEAQTLRDKAHNEAKTADKDVVKYQDRIDSVHDKYQAQHNNRMQTINALIRDAKETVSGFGTGAMHLANAQQTLLSGSSSAFARYIDVFREMFNQLYSHSKDQQKGMEEQINSLIQTWTKIADTNKESFAIRSH